jgi:hypothetical protein
MSAVRASKQKQSIYPKYKDNYSIIKYTYWQKCQDYTTTQV